MAWYRASSASTLSAMGCIFLSSFVEKEPNSFSKKDKFFTHLPRGAPPHNSTL